MKEMKTLHIEYDEYEDVQDFDVSCLLKLKGRKLKELRKNGLKKGYRSKGRIYQPFMVPIL